MSFLPRRKETLLRGHGVREIGAGIGALSVDPTPAMWSRVGGDLLDHGTLAIGFRDGDAAQRRNAGMAIAAVAGVTIVDLITAASLTRERRDYGDRSGSPGGVAKARGQARGDFETPRDMKAAPAEARVSGETEPA